MGILTTFRLTHWKIYLGVQVKEEEPGGRCGRHEGEDKCILGFSGKT